jgi:hypothetical protein
MTGSQTDAVFVPRYQQAAAILMALASPLFHRSIYGKTEPDPECKLFEAWQVLRHAAERMYVNHSTEMTVQQREAIIPALKLCHDLAHDYDPGPTPDLQHCGCLLASRLIELTMLLACHAEESVAA